MTIYKEKAIAIKNSKIILFVLTTRDQIDKKIGMGEKKTAIKIHIYSRIPD
jgi:hypothetical protein